MQLSNSPDKLVLPFAEAGGKRTIPTDSQISVTPGAASLTDGFPPLTRTPLSAGGVPPSGIDMNGILYELSAVVRWANACGGYAYDSDFATDSNVGGYPKGARVMRSDGLGYWINTIENNTIDPEATGAATAGWVPDFTSGATAITMTNANVTLSASQYGKPIVVITGLLTSNLNLIFPAIPFQWLVINATTGSYTITSKTASGTGVIVYGAMSIVCDGTNILSQIDGFSSKITQFANVADLRLNSKSGILYAETAGYYASGDSGGGQYLYDSADTSTADDGFRCLVDSRGQRWKLNASGYYTPRMAGAKGDGTSDDTLAFQKVAAAIATSTKISAFHISKGNYNISDAINCPFSGVVSGDGVNASVVRMTNTTKNGFTTIGGSGLITFTDFSIVGTVAHTAGAAILADTTTPTDGAQQNITLRNMAIASTFDGFRANNAGYWRVTGCHFYECTHSSVFSECTSNFDAGDNSIDGGTVIIGGGSANNVTLRNNCRITDTKILSGARGVYIEPAGAAGSRVDIQIGGSVSIENYSTTGILCVASATISFQNSSIIGCQFGTSSAGARAIDLQGLLGGWVIANNIIILSSTASAAQVGMSISTNPSGTPYLMEVIGNLITGGESTSVGIYMDASNSIMSDNHLTNAGTTFNNVNSGTTIRNQSCVFAALPSTVANGSILYVSNGTAATPVASGGTGCIAKRLNGVWVGN